MKRHTSQEIESAEFDVQQMKKEYLWSRGWRSDGSYPGGLILWHKSEKGYGGCNLDTAYSLESYSEQTSGRVTFSEDHVIKDHDM